MPELGGFSRPAMTSLRQAVFFDRDGILVEAPVVDGHPKSARTVEDLILIPAAVHLCAELAGAGVLLFMITNQPNISRMKVDPRSVDQQNQIVAKACQLTAVRVCPHDDSSGCHCRKPRPGMITDLAKEYSIDLIRSVVVGDRWRDIEAGTQAGSQTVFVDYGYDERQPTDQTASVRSVEEAATIVKALLNFPAAI